MDTPSSSRASNPDTRRPQDAVRASVHIAPDEDEMPHVRVRNSRGKLDEWIREVVSKNLLYVMHDIGEMNDDEVIGEVVDEYRGP